MNNEDEPKPLMPSDEHFARAAKILAPVFVANGWEWKRSWPTSRIPTESEIEEALRDLAKNIVDGFSDGVDWSASGRLIARSFSWREGGEVEIRLGLEILEISE